MVDSMSHLALPAYAGELARGRRRGLRPPTASEMRGGPQGLGCGADFEVVVMVTDSWVAAKFWRQMGQAAVVIEPGPLYDFRWARGWIVLALTRAPFPGLKQWIREQGASWASHFHDPDRLSEIEARARA